MSATLSIIFKNYQLLFLTPGISPLLAISLKQILHNPNFLINALFFPHLKHLLVILVENLGSFSDFAIDDFFAINYI